MFVGGCFFGVRKQKLLSEVPRCNGVKQLLLEESCPTLADVGDILFHTSNSTRRRVTNWTSLVGHVDPRRAWPNYP